MATHSTIPPNLIFGTASIGDTSVDPLARFDGPEEVNRILNTFAARGHTHLDTARNYSPIAPGTSEPRLGAVNAGEKFVIDTKVKSRDPGDHTKAKILEEIDISLEALKIKQINTEYLHVPDRVTKFEEACEAMDIAYRQGKIKQWGLSNYSAAEVQSFIDICEEHGFVKPSVYQGQYNTIVRGGEKELFPLLRRHNMAFYAYSAAAGGLFAGNHKKPVSGGRFDKSNPIGGLYASFYLKPSIMGAVDRAISTASQHGISGHSAVLRWAAYHSALSKEHGDSIVIGASSSEQLDANIDMIEQGPLPDDVAAAFDSVYGAIGSESEIPYHL